MNKRIKKKKQFIDFNKLKRKNKNIKILYNMNNNCIATGRRICRRYKHLDVRLVALNIVKYNRTHLIINVGGLE